MSLVIILVLVLILFAIAIAIFVIFRGQKKIEVKEPIQQPSEPVVFPVRPTQPQQPVVPQVQLFPYKVIGASDGSWFQVLDQNGNIVASLNEPNSKNEFEQVCPNGSSVEYIGITRDQNGPKLSTVGCYYPVANTTVFQGQKDNIDTIYSLGKNTREIDGCKLGIPSMFESVGITGYLGTRGIGKIAKGISYICVPEQTCSSQSQCPPDTLCTGGKCVPFDQL